MSLAATAAQTGSLPEYRLRSDLAQYCLPVSNQDETRKLAWANSISLLFVLVACMGLRQPVFVIREVAPLPEPLRAELVPQSEPEKAEPDEEEPPAVESQDEIVELPVVTPVQVALPNEVNFSVPVEGFLQLSPDARFVPPPPPVIPKAPPPDSIPKPEFRSIRFGGKEFKKQPPPGYPEEFQRNRIGGTVEALITIGPNGVPTKVEVGRSSGNPALDRHVCDFIRREWRAEPGEGAAYRIAITFAP